MKYLSNSECVNRLVNEYIKYGSLIVAYDYDNTVYDYHKEKDDYSKIVNLLRECNELGFCLVVFTSSSEDRFESIIEYLTINDIPFDAINENPYFIPFRGRNIFYNHFLDDRAGLKSSYKILKKAVKKIKKLINYQNSYYGREKIL